MYPRSLTAYVAISARRLAVTKINGVCIEAARFLMDLNCGERSYSH